MTENDAGDAAQIDATPTVSQPVHLADQQPLTPAPAPVVVADKRSHTRTILEVVGGVVAVGLIFVSGAAGFVLGHVTARDDGRGDRGHMMLRIDSEGGNGALGGRAMPGRPDFQGGQGLQGGEDFQGGQDFRGGPGPDSDQGGLPSFPGQDSAPVLPEQGTAPSAPQG